MNGRHAGTSDVKTRTGPRLSLVLPHTVGHARKPGEFNALLV
jgi:hypothetical protein